MENVNYNLSEHEFSKGRKVLLWGFSMLFFIAGLGVIFMNVILHNKSIHIVLSLAPFTISLATGLIAAMATLRKKDHFFIIDDNKIEFKYGIINPLKQTYLWNDVTEMHLPHKEKKVKLIMKDSQPVVIDLTWLEKKKSSFLRKHFYYDAKEKNINVVKLIRLPKK